MGPQENGAMILSAKGLIRDSKRIFTEVGGTRQEKEDREDSVTRSWKLSVSTKFKPEENRRPAPGC